MKVKIMEHGDDYELAQAIAHWNKINCPDICRTDKDEARKFVEKYGRAAPTGPTSKQLAAIDSIKLKSKRFPPYLAYEDIRVASWFISQERAVRRARYSN